MNVLGIIAEYNPFHNGHLYHIKQSCTVSKTQKVVVIMSGNFVQRGDLAIMDKHLRAKLAVQTVLLLYWNYLCCTHLKALIFLQKELSKY